MEDGNVFFASSTCRLRNVADAIAACDANFRRDGRSLKLTVLDDSSVANRCKFLPTDFPKRLAFESNFSRQNVIRVVDDAVRLIHAALEIWPTLVEIY